MSLHRVSAGRAWSGIATLAMLAGGCFDPSFQDPLCGPGGECPSGWTCAAGENMPCVLGPPPAGDPDAMPATCDDAQRTWMPVLANGNFEAGVQGWAFTPASSDPIRMEMDGLPVLADDGQWASLLGEDDGVDQVLSQAVTLPAGTTRLRLSGLRCFATNEVDAMTAFDHLYARLGPVDAPAETLVEIIAWSNRNGAASCNWSPFEREVEVPGLPVAAQFRLQTDLNDARLTTFYLDRLDLAALACPPALAAEAVR